MMDEKTRREAKRLSYRTETTTHFLTAVAQTWRLYYVWKINSTFQSIRF